MVSVIIGIILLIGICIFIQIRFKNGGIALSAILLGVLCLFMFLVLIGSWMPHSVVEVKDYPVYKYEQKLYYGGSEKLIEVPSSLKTEVDPSIAQPCVRYEHYDNFYWVQFPIGRLMLPENNIQEIGRVDG